MGNLLQREQRYLQSPDLITEQERLQPQIFIESLKEYNCKNASEIIRHFKETFQNKAEDETQPTTLDFFSDKDGNIMNLMNLHKIKSITNSTIQSYTIPDEISSKFVNRMNPNMDLNIDQIVIYPDGTQEASFPQFRRGNNYVSNLANVSCTENQCTCKFQDGTEKEEIFYNPIPAANKTG